MPLDYFGTVTALVRGKAWISDTAQNAVIATYDTTNKRLAIGAHNVNHFGRYRGIALSVCDDLEARRYAFAPTPNGPYGAAACVLGVVGHWWEPSTDNVNHFASHGEAEDTFVVEELDTSRMRIRGSFRFRAHSETGAYVAEISGRFFGRLAFQ